MDQWSKIKSRHQRSSGAIDARHSSDLMAVDMTLSWDHRSFGIAWNANEDEGVL
jgi:hypothetical protein